MTYKQWLHKQAATRTPDAQAHPDNSHMDTDVYLTVCRGVSQYPKYGAPQGSPDSTSGRASVVARHVDDIHPLHFIQRVCMDVLVGVRDMTGQEKRNDGCRTGGCPLAVTPAIRCQMGGSSGATQTPRAAKKQEPVYAMETNLQQHRDLANTVGHDHINTSNTSQEIDNGLANLTSSATRNIYVSQA